MTLFAVNETEFGWEEIAAAADAWGEWQPFFELTRNSLACLRFAAESKQMPSGGEVKEALTAFRYAHNLISADETQNWLRRWELTIDDLMNYLRGQLLLERWGARLGEVLAAHPISHGQVSEVIKNYAVCADKLGDWALRLAGRAAIAAKSGPLDAGGQDSRMAPRELVACIEAEFENQRAKTVTPKLIETKIADHRLDWVRFDCHYAWFGEDSIAREALFCVTEDGLTLDEVAEDARTVVQQWSFYLDEIETGARPHFLAAREGDWLGPMKMLEGFPLFSIAKKKMPQADDPQIRARAEAAIVRAWTEQAMNERVRWMI